MSQLKWMGTALCTAAFALVVWGAPAAASADQAWDQKAVAETAKQLAKDVEQARKTLENDSSAKDNKQLAHELKQIEGHARHLHMGLESGNDRMQTTGAAKSLRKLVDKAKKDAQGGDVPQDVRSQLDAADQTAAKLAAYYGETPAVGADAKDAPKKGD